MRLSRSFEENDHVDDGDADANVTRSADNIRWNLGGSSVCTVSCCPQCGAADQTVKLRRQRVCVHACVCGETMRRWNREMSGKELRDVLPVKLGFVLKAGLFLLLSDLIVIKLLSINKSTRFERCVTCC